MNNAWEVWTAALSAGECDAIVARAELYVCQPATVGFADTARTDPSFRSSTVRWLDAGTERALVDRLMQFVASSNRSNFGAEIVAPYELQFTEYHAAAEGQYGWHQDVWLESPRPFDRKLSLVLQLSDPADYAGGQFEFFGLPSPAAAFMPLGSILVFPSFLQHRVLPVTAGIRRSLVTWVEGPRWR